MREKGRESKGGGEGEREKEREVMQRRKKRLEMLSESGGDFEENYTHAIVYILG